jgi:microcin C transport system substrate-binding protein
MFRMFSHEDAKIQNLSAVIPAKAGIHAMERIYPMDPGFRRDDVHLFSSCLRAFVVIFLFFAPIAAHAADETVKPQPAIALHGDPKYAPDFKHFDYVNPDAPKGGTLRLHDEGTFDSLNPFIVKGNPAAGMSFLGAGLVYESLMDQSNDEPFTMYGLLAESIELPKDHSWVAFNIRPQARWADGRKVTADDVVWTFNTMMDKGTPFFKAYYGDVAKVEMTSPARVKFTFKHAGNTELPLIVSQMSVLPKHYWEAPGHDIAATTLEPPLGSGPYKIGAVKAPNSIEYVRDPNWWGANLPIYKGRWNFDRIVYDYYKDSDVALEAFIGGQYDVREENVAKLWATAYNAPPVADGRITKAEIANKRPQGMQAWVYNIRRPIFKDRAVREALAYAFDFEWENKQFAYGSYTRTRSYFSNSDLESSGLPQGRELEILQKFKGKIPDEVFTAEYNPPKTDGSGNNRGNLLKAVKILEAAGYKTGADGVRINAKTGQRLDFEIIDANPAFERWTLPFLQNLKKIGVHATFRAVDPAQLQNRMNNFDFDVTTASFGESDSPGNEQKDYWGSAKANAPGSRNYIGVQDPVVDEIIDMLVHAQSREDLVACVHALDRVLQWNFYVIPQWHLSFWRLAWWKGIEKPATLSRVSPGIADTWWHAPEKK